MVVVDGIVAACDERDGRAAQDRALRFSLDPELEAMATAFSGVKAVYEVLQ
jgi:hypothetical protein